VSQETLHRPFEFVVTKSGGLDKMTNDWSKFKEHVEKARKEAEENMDVVWAISFPNLDRSGILVIPDPNPAADFKDLSSFIKNAPENEKFYF